MDINSNSAEQDICGKIVEEVKKQEEARADLKKQWLVNVMFLYGKHHFTASRKYSADIEDSMAQRIAWEIGNAKNPNNVRRTSNYILPLFRSVYSRLLSMKANVHAEPTTHTERDRDAARVGKEVAEDFWQNCNRNNPWLCDEFSGMQAIMMKLILYKMTVGHGYLIPYFNQKATSKVYDQMSKQIIEADVGEAEIRVQSPMNMFRDPFGRHYIERRFLCPEQIEYEYNQMVEPDKLDDNNMENRINALLEGESYDKDKMDGSYVYIKNCNPSSAYPEGRQLAVTKSKILFEGPLPMEAKKKVSVFQFKYQDLGFSTNAQGAIEQLVDLQMDYNFTLTRIAHLKKNGAGKILAPRGSKMSAKWDDEINQIIFYNQGAKPEYLAPAQVPSYYYEELQRIRRDMEDIANAHDASVGRTPTGVKSGVGIQNLSELDNSQITPELIMFEQKLGFTMETVLDICQERYNERRLLSITGEDMAYEIKSFIGSELFGQKKILIKMGSGLPNSKQERQQYIMLLADKGYISQDRAKELLEFGDVDGVYTSLDENKAKQDIINIIEGGYIVIAEPFEDHTIFLKVINDFRKGSVYPKLDPQIQMQINDLAMQHQDYLLNEQAAAQSMGGALPPPAMPQQPSGQGSKQ